MPTRPPNHYASLHRSTLCHVLPVCVAARPAPPCDRGDAQRRAGHSYTRAGRRGARAVGAAQLVARVLTPRAPAGAAPPPTPPTHPAHECAHAPTAAGRPPLAAIGLSPGTSQSTSPLYIRGRLRRRCSRGEQKGCGRGGREAGGSTHWGLCATAGSPYHRSGCREERCPRRRAPCCCSVCARSSPAPACAVMWGSCPASLCSACADATAPASDQGGRRSIGFELNPAGAASSARQDNTEVDPVTHLLHLREWDAYHRGMAPDVHLSARLTVAVQRRQRAKCTQDLRGVAKRRRLVA